jgi:hypothetical protein
MRRELKLLAGLLLGLFLSMLAWGQEAPPLSNGQVIYLPVYSHIYHGSLDRKGKPSIAMLSALVSVRNTDPRRAIRVTSARYFDTEGRLLREFVSAPRSVPAFGTFELFVEQHDDSGGSGANFTIAWEADTPVNPPLVEAVHATIEGARSLTFTTVGRPLRQAN